MQFGIALKDLWAHSPIFIPQSTSDVTPKLTCQKEYMLTWNELLKNWAWISVAYLYYFM